jgi:hypothetical protein
MSKLEGGLLLLLLSLNRDDLGFKIESSKLALFPWGHGASG